MTLNIAMVTEALDHIWMSYRGPHMLTGLPADDSHPKFSHTMRLGNTEKPLFLLILCTGMWYWSLSLDNFSESKQFLGKCALPVP